MIICDVCDAELNEERGRTEITIRPPKHNTAKLAAAFATHVMAGGEIPELPSELATNLDLCLACTEKMVRHLGIGVVEDTAVPSPADVHAAKLAGGQGPLTADDLRALGIDPVTPDQPAR